MPRRLLIPALVLFLASSLSGDEIPAFSALNPEEARRAIVDETVEPYFSLLMPLEMSVKTGRPITGQTLEAQREEARKRYRDGVRNWSPRDVEALHGYVRQLHPILSANYPAISDLPWRFIQVADTLEGGLPHTRGDQIVLSESVVAQMVAMWERDAVAALKRFGGLLVHEQMHVFQRLYPQVMRPLYTELWGFEYAAHVVLPEGLIARVVVNPDGVDLNWVYPIEAGGQRRYITPRIVFAEGKANPRMGHDFEMISVTVEPSDSGFAAADPPDIRPLREETGYLPDLLREPLGSIYHPNELAADCFARILVLEHLSGLDGDDPRLRSLHKHLGPTRAWFRKHLAR